MSNAVRLGIVSAALIVILEVLYLAALLGGLLALDHPADPIGDPYFTAMEILILAMMPPIVLLTVAVHSWCEADRRPFAMAAIVFAALLTGLTSAVHMSILFLGRHPAFAGMERLLSFEWPSLVYVLDILAWDVFFGLAAVFLALVFPGDGPGRWIRRMLLASGLLALAGLAGAVAGNMQIRNIAILGYVGLFPVAAVLIARHLRDRDPPQDGPTGRRAR